MLYAICKTNLKMIEITQIQSRQLDKILTTLVKRKEISSVNDIQKKLFPNETYEYCASLFYILKDHYPELLLPISGPTEGTFWRNDYVKAFLNQGGFSKEFDDTYTEQQKESKIEKLKLEKLKYDIKNSKRMFKTYWWTFAFALIAFIISIYNFLRNLLS